MREFFNLLRPRQSTIACDLGAHSLRAVQLRMHARTPRVCDALETEIPPGSPSGPRPELISGIVEQAAFVGRDITLVLSPPEVTFFPTRLPDAALAQSPERLESALKWEAAQQSRASADELELRYWMLPRGAGPCPNVMAAVLPRGLAVGWCDALASAGLVLKRIEASPCANVRLALALRAMEPGALWGVLDLGTRHTTLTVAIGETPVYIRALSIVTREWVRLVAEAFELPEATAEELLSTEQAGANAHPAPGAAGGAAVLEATQIDGAVATVLNGSIGFLAREIERCLGYVLQSYPEATASHLFVTGRGVRVSGLCAALSRALECPVEPLASGGVFPQAAPKLDRASGRPHALAAAAAALGAALGDVECS